MATLTQASVSGQLGCSVARAVITIVLVFTSTCCPINVFRMLTIHINFISTLEKLLADLLLFLKEAIEIPQSYVKLFTMRTSKKIAFMTSHNPDLRALSRYSTLALRCPAG